AIKRDSEALNADRQELRLRQRTLQAQMLDTYDSGKGLKLFALLKQNNVWVVPTQIWGKRLLPLNANAGIDPLAESLLPLKLRADFAQRHSEGINAAAPESFVLRQRIAEQTREMVKAMHQARVLLLAGTDAFDGDVLPGLGLHQELELMVQSGLSPLEALQTATLNAAKFFGESRTRGTVEVGKLADLILLDADPLQNISNTQKIHALIIHGQLISASQRETLLDKIKAYANAEARTQ
ncbi:MAG TPA: amidohydrolase family protein, partial [Blastocatellia bacterium]|nr:amidohydrolase family protein [Blastocatellia bacterium]